MRNFNNSTIGNSVKIGKALKVAAAILVVYAVLRLVLFTALFDGVADVVGAFVIAIICVYFTGKCQREVHEREVEAKDEAMLEEAPVLAQPTQAAPTPVVATTSLETTATEATKQFVAPSYRNGLSIKNAQMYVDDEKVAVMEQSKTVNELQRQIDEEARMRSQLVVDYNATFGQQATSVTPNTVTNP